MAEKVKLRDYQQSILDRLESVKVQGADAPVSYLGVVIADQHVLVDLRDISETLPVTDMQSVPLVKPWFLGVSNVRGVLYAINDLAQLLGHAYTQISSSTRMLLFSERVSPNVAFLVDRLIGLRSLDMMTKQETQAEDGFCLSAEIYEDVDKRVWRVLDSDKLLHSKEFAIPYVS